MKKIIYSILFAATTLLTATSCGDDDDNNSDCLVCEEGSVCDNGDGTVTISLDGEEDETLDLEELCFANFAELEAVGCEEDNDDEIEDDEMVATECASCAAGEFLGQPVPAAEACRLENGNASVGGFDLGITFEQWLSTQEAFTTCTIATQS